LHVVESADLHTAVSSMWCFFCAPSSPPEMLVRALCPLLAFDPSVRGGSRRGGALAWGCSCLNSNVATPVPAGVIVKVALEMVAWLMAATAPPTP
jgi:hypothetical protein